MDDIPRNLFVNVRWTDSNLLIAVTEHGDQTGEQYITLEAQDCTLPYA